MLNGYDLELIHSISESVSIPVIAAGGASCLQDFVDAIIIGRGGGSVEEEVGCRHQRESVLFVFWIDDAVITVT